jgi:hypothetical protein
MSPTKAYKGQTGLVFKEEAWILSRVSSPLPYQALNLPHYVFFLPFVIAAFEC